MAAQKNKLKLLKFCVSHGGSTKGALVASAANGHLEVVEYLLSLGSDVDVRDDFQKNTPLIRAAHGGADINATDKFGQTALDKSKWSENKELIAFLKGGKKK